MPVSKLQSIPSGRIRDAPMNNAGCLMQIFNGLCNLNNHVSAQIFAKVCQSHDLVEQLSTRAEFENDVVVLSRFGKVHQLDDVWVVEVAHNLDFLEDVHSLQDRYQQQPRLKISKNRVKENRDKGRHCGTCSPLPIEAVRGVGENMHLRSPWDLFDAGMKVVGLRRRKYWQCYLTQNESVETITTKQKNRKRGSHRDRKARPFGHPT